MKITNTFLIKTIILIQFVFLINLVSYNPLLSQTTITKQITASSDDAEEEGSQGTYNAKGAVFTTGIYLELISDNQEPLGLGNQTVGLRFNSIDIPNHAEITNAYLVFHCLPPDENNLNSALAKLTIKGQASDNPFTFVASSTGNFNISDLKARPQTQASVSWNPDQWLEGNDYNSPDLKSIIQELINRKGWVSNNSMAFIISGAGSRTTESFDYLGNNPPKLVISYNKNFTVNHDDKHIDEVGSELSMLDNPVITSQPLGSTICKGGSFSPDVVATGGNSALNYQWQYSSNGSTNWNNVINGTPSNATYTSNTSPTLFTVTGNLLSGSYYYRCVITSSGAGSISINSNTAILKVLPDPTVIVQPLSATICVGSTYAPYLIASGGTPSLTYQWQFSPTGFSGWSNVVNGSPTNSSFVGATSPSSFSVSGNLAVGAYYFRCVVSSVGGGCNSTYTINAVLTVGESPVIILQPTSASLCKAVSYNPIIKALGGTPTYQWQYSEDGINAWEYVKNGIPANSKYTGATTSNGFNVNGNLNSGNYFYRCIVSSNGCSASISNVATLTIVQNAEFTTQPLDAIICIGGTYAPDVETNSSSTINTYQWQFSTNGITGWANVVNGTPANATYSGSISSKAFNVSGNLAAGIYFYRCIVSNKTSGCTGISSVGKLTIVGDPVITQQPVSFKMCVGGTFQPNIFATGGLNGLSYQWQFSANGSVGWANVTNGTPTNAVYVNPTSPSSYSVSGNMAAGTYYYRCVISSSGSGCGTTTSSNAVITIVADPSISLQPINETICQGGSFSPKVSAKDGVPNLVCQWQYSENGSTGWANVSNGTPLNATYNNSTSPSSFSVNGNLPAGKYYYRGIVSSFSSGCNSVTSENAVLTVLAGSEILIQPIDATICKGGTYQPGITLANGSYNYQWQYSTNGNSIWANVVNGTPTNGVYSASTNNLFSVSGNINPGSYYYRCIVNSKASGCSNTSAFGKLTVVSDPNILIQPINASIIEGGTYTPGIMADGGTPALNYQWQYSLNGTTLWANVTNGTPANSTYTNPLSATLFTVVGNIAPGNYYYRCLVSSAGNGCDPVNSSNGVLTVIKKPGIQDLYSDNGGQIISNPFTLTSEKLLIFPNPTNDLINFETGFSNDKTYDVSIHDGMGKLILAVRNSDAKQFNISSLANGVYIVKLVSETGIMTAKFIKGK